MKDKHRKFLIYWLPVVLYCTAIFIQSSYPSVARLPDLPFGDKYLHVAGYALLGILFFRAIRSSHGGNRISLVILLSISAATAYGISDEIHQYFTPGRVADLYDVTADILGSLTGVLLYQFFIHKYYASFPYHSHMDKIEIFI